MSRVCLSEETRFCSSENRLRRATIPAGTSDSSAMTETRPRRARFVDIEVPDIERLQETDLQAPKQLAPPRSISQRNYSST